MLKKTDLRGQPIKICLLYGSKHRALLGGAITSQIKNKKIY